MPEPAGKIIIDLALWRHIILECDLYLTRAANGLYNTASRLWSKKRESPEIDEATRIPFVYARLL
jgi:hypothetical protein